MLFFKPEIWDILSLFIKLSSGQFPDEFPVFLHFRLGFNERIMLSKKNKIILAFIDKVTDIKSKRKKEGKRANMFRIVLDGKAFLPRSVLCG